MAAKTKSKAKKSVGTTASLAPTVAPGSPKNFRARVRMYRHGLGDCFLLTFPRTGTEPFQILIDCGALARDKAAMTQVVEHIRETVRDGKPKGKARLDAVVGTHEHKDHLSGFNQARDVFNDDFDFGSVWLAWTENLSKPEVTKIKETRRRAIKKLETALATPVAQAAMVSPTGASLTGVSDLLTFSGDDDTTGAGKIAEAFEYLKLRGSEAGDLRYLEPGAEPFRLDGVDGVRVYVLGPPRDPLLLKTSQVTEKMKQEGVVYHLARTGEAGIDALCAALADQTDPTAERGHPFSPEHRIGREMPDPFNPKQLVPNPYFAGIDAFVAATYENPAEAWRKIDDAWLSAFGQLAVDLDNDTNNTSLVLAFEFEKSGEVLLFVADAQVGSWQSWAKLKFKVPGQAKLVPARDLLARTVFYKVGHHCSHNATLKAGGLEVMTRHDLVAFIPLDKETARKQGRTQPSGQPQGWDMPAAALYKALRESAADRVVISDVNESLSPNAVAAGVKATALYIDYFLR